VHWRVTLGEDNVVRNIGMYHDAITIRFYALQTIMGLFLIVSLSKRSTSLMLLSLMYGSRLPSCSKALTANPAL